MTTMVQSPFDLDELLYLICIFVECEDLKALSASNRRIYTIASPILQNHRVYWAKFQNLEDRPNPSHWYWHKIAVSLLTNSLGAPYVRHIKTGLIDGREHYSSRQYLNIREPMKDWDIASESERMIPLEIPGQQFDRFGARVRKTPFVLASTAITNDDMAVLTDHSKSCDWLSDDEKMELVKGLRSGYQAFIRAILLPLLPNLKTLKIEWSSSNIQRHLGAAVRHAAITHSLNSRCNSFSKLVSVDFTTDAQTLESIFSSTGNQYSLDFLSYFMSLPKLRKILAQLVVAQSFTRTESLRPPTVTDISFFDQDISPSAFRDLLAD